MAQVRLHLAEASGGGLPRVCMKCGAPTERENQLLEILWIPPWVYLLLLACIVPYVFVAPSFTKSAILYAPFCHQHHNHWRRRQLIVGVLCVLFGVNFVVPFVFQSWIGVACCLLLIPIIIVWIARVQLDSVRATEVTDTHLVLDGVCEEFIQAMLKRDDAIARAIELDEPPAKPPKISSSTAIEVHEERKSDAIRE